MVNSRGIGTALIGILGGIMGLAMQSPPDPQKFRVESALVTVPVIVSDLQGRFIPELKANSFRLFQDGFAEPISLFLTTDEPIKIALLLDTSKSTTPVLKAIKKAATRFLVQMRPQDSAMIVKFDSEIQVLSPLSTDRQGLIDAINRAKAVGISTRMRDAIADIAQQKFRSIPGRKAIVLLTDGQDHGSTLSPADLLDAVASSSTLIYSVFYSVDPAELMKELLGVASRLPSPAMSRKKGIRSIWAEREEEAARYLAQISELSAGRFYRSNNLDFDKAFKEISEELRSQYLLGFYPNKSKLDGQLHELEVRVTVPNSLVRSRRKYRAIR